MSRLLFAILALTLSPLCTAAEPEEPPGAAPPQVESGEVPEPEVTIIETDEGKIQQYSINGHVYMVRIVPTSGKPYYLLDLDGDGTMDVRRDRPQDISVPQWVLFSW